MIGLHEFPVVLNGDYTKVVGRLTLDMRRLDVEQIIECTITPAHFIHIDGEKELAHFSMGATPMRGQEFVEIGSLCKTHRCMSMSRIDFLKDSICVKSDDVLACDWTTIFEERTNNA